MKKFLKISVFVFAGLFLLLVVLGWALEDHITELAVDQVSQTVEAPLGVEDVHFSLVKHFPLASISFDGFWIASPQVDSITHEPLDTLVKVGHLYAYIDAIDAFNNIITVRELNLSDGFVHYAVNMNGVTSFDFLLSSDTTNQLPEQDTVQTHALDFAIESIGFKNIHCQYRDAQLNAAATLTIDEIRGELDIDSTKVLAAMNGACELRDLRYDETNLNRMQSLDVTFDVFYHNDTIRTNTFSVQTEGLALRADGDFILGERMYTDMGLTLTSESLATLLKYAPDTLLSNHEVSQISGAFELTTKLQGEVAKDVLPYYEASLVLSDATMKYRDYPLAYNLTIDLDATNGVKNNNETTEIKLNKLETDFDGSHIALEANLSNLDKIRYDLRSNMDLDLTKVKKLIPDSIINQLSGNLKAFVATNGILPDSIDNDFIRQLVDATELDLNLTDVNMKMDSIIELKNISASAKFKQCQFDLIDMEVYLPEYDLPLFDNSINACITGDILNPNNLNIDISSFRIGMPDSSYVWGQASLGNLKDISYDIQTDLNLDLSFWQQFVPDTIINDVSGRLSAKIKSYGAFHLDSIKTEIQDIVFDQTTVDLGFEDVKLDMNDTLINVKNLNGSITVADHKANIDEIEGNYMGVDVRIAKATVENPFNTTIKNQSGFIKIDGEYYFGAIDYTALGVLLAGKKSDHSKSKSTKKTIKPKNWNLDLSGTLNAKSIRYDSATLLTGVKVNYQLTDTVFEVKGKLAVDRIDYGDAVISDVTGLYNYSDSKGSKVFTLDKLNANLFGGSLNTSMKVLKKDESTELQMRHSIQNIDIKVLMKQMDNLSAYQKELTYEQVSGNFTSDSLFIRIKMEEKSVNFNSFRMVGDLVFEDGGVYNYKVLQDMAKEISTIKSLDTLAFKTIRSSFFGFKDALYIPRTYLVSNKFDIKMRAQQHFGIDYKYQLGFHPFSIINAKKSKKTQEKQEVYGDETGDQLKNFTWIEAFGVKGEYKNRLLLGKNGDAARIKMENDIFSKERSNSNWFKSNWKFDFDTGVN